MLQTRQPLVSDEELPPVEEQLSRNVTALLKARGWTQDELAKRMKQNQPWVNRRIKQGVRWQVQDLNALSEAFGFSPSELLQPRFGEWDRRSGQDRRSGKDRREM